MRVKKKIVAVIPLRGGSTSIPLKNIRAIAGKPLCYWVIEAAKKSGCFDEIWVSTDHRKIKGIALSYGVKVVDRPAKYASNTATEGAMLNHFASRVDFDILADIHATSPLTTAEDIKKALKMFKRGGYDSMLTGVRWKGFLWDDNFKPVNYNPKRRPRRQDMKGWLKENGAFYITTRDTLARHNDMLGSRIGIYEMDEEDMIELDEPLDWQIVETLLRKRLKKK